MPALNRRVPHVDSMFGSRPLRAGHPRIYSYYCEHCDAQISEEQWDRCDGLCGECDQFCQDHNE